MRRNKRLPFQLRHIPTLGLILSIGRYSSDGRFVSFHHWNLDFSFQQNHIVIDKRQWYDKILPHIDLWFKYIIVNSFGLTAAKVNICGAGRPMPKWMAISLLNMLKKYKISFKCDDLMKLEKV